MNTLPRIALIALLLTICSVFFLAAPYFGVAQMSPSSPFTEWGISIHSTQNSFHMWRFDSLTSLLSTPFATITAMTERFHVAPVQLCILFLGIGLLLTSRVSALAVPTIAAWISAFLLTSLIPIMFGRDVVVFGVLQWLPFFTLSLCALRTITLNGITGATLPTLIIVHFFSLLSAQAANQFSILTASLAYAVAALLSSQTSTAHGIHSAESRPLYVRTTLQWFFYLSPLMYPLYTVFTAPLPEFPHYPYDGLLVPDDGAPGVVRPNVGLDLPLATINRDAVRAITLAFSAPLFLLCGYLYSRLTSSHAKKCAGALFIALAVLLADSLLPEQIALSLPTHTLQRLVPGQTALPWNAAIVGILTLLVGSLITALAPLFGPLLLLGGVITSKAFLLVPSLGMALAVPYTTQSAEQFVELVYSPTASGEVKRILLSPSAQIPLHFSYLFFPNHVPDFDTAQRFAHLKPLRIGKKLRSIESSPPSATPLISLLTDKNTHTRWSPGGGAQQPGQSLTLRFDTPVRFAGISMETGEFITDYPRGIRVTIPAECLDADSVGGSWEFPTWRGPLRFTSDRYPYFGHLGDVAIAFGVEVTSQCVVIEQTGRDPNYDWSVTEIALLVLP